jgi:hypothetical protein
VKGRVVEMPSSSTRRAISSLITLVRHQHGGNKHVRLLSNGTRTVRGSSSKESFFSEGKNEPGGLLFNESPQQGGRQWESWEGPWYFAFGAATAILTIGLSAKPDTSLVSWAEREALKRREQ